MIPFVRKDSYLPNKKMVPLVIGNGYTTVDGANGPAPEYETVTGNPVSFNAITPFPLRKLQVAFSPVQSLNGYDAPWPAGGGKNKLPDSDSTATIYDVTMVESNGKFTFTGTANSSGGRYALKTPSFSLKAGTYYAKVFNETGSVIPTLIVQKGTEYFSGAGAFTLTEDVDNINIGFNVASGSVYNYSAYVGVFTENVTTYSPYSNICPISGWNSLTVYHSGADTSNPQTISISLGQTVYSGYVDVISGVGEITWAAVDMGSLVWSYTSPSAGIPYGYFDVTNIGYKPTGGFMCSCYKVVSAGWAVDKTIRNHGSIDKLYVIDGSYDSKDSFKQAVTGQYICYELATPIPIQLTPQEIQSLLGVNNMWSDANGDLTVEYRSN